MNEEEDISAARVKARELLARIEDEPGTLRFFNGELGVPEYDDYGDFLVFNWNSVEYMKSGDKLDALIVGPIAVPKGGAEDAFFVGTSLDVPEALEKWRRERLSQPGYEVCVIEVSSGAAAGTSFLMDSRKFDAGDEYDNACLDFFLALKGLGIAVEFESETIPLNSDGPELPDWTELRELLSNDGRAGSDSE
ncbi:hypothetical protein ACIP5Y_33050 [Nocardia sp. NPDC088792]|uniref:hypothetical protein n=1 Tax=Nocardia sp. NPDC088792 TaxID=3364332 RepID=UPI0038239DDA